LGGRCTACAAISFPRATRCARCRGDNIDEVELSAEGTLWTFTSQDFPLKEPYLGAAGGEFEPFTLGYVELAEGIKVEARITEPDVSKLYIGMPMRLTIQPWKQGQGGLGYAFSPGTTAQERS
jgi:uncharacterized OB-fold protein